jgi:hypothetical protein
VLRRDVAVTRPESENFHAMAALALHQTRSFFSTFRLPWLTRPTPAPASQTPFNLALPMLQPLLDLLPAIVLAVPKSKISHSRKSMRSANKGLKDKQSTLHSVPTAFVSDRCPLQTLSTAQLVEKPSLLIAPAGLVTTPSLQSPGSRLAVHTALCPIPSRLQPGPRHRNIHVGLSG